MPDNNKQIPKIAICKSSKLYDLNNMLEVEPKLRNVPYSRMAATKNFQMFLSPLIIYQVLESVVFYC